MGFISLMLVLYFPKAQDFFASITVSVTHTYTLWCMPHRGGLLLESLVGSSKQLLPDLTEGFCLCRTIKTEL